MRRHITLGFQFGRQFRHRDIRLRLDPLEQSRQMRRQFTSPRRTTLPRWPGRTRPRYQIRQLYCKACADIVPPRLRPARLTAIDLRLNPFPKINRIRLPHPCWPPSIPASILNQTSDSLGIPFRFLFHARRSRVPAPKDQARGDENRWRPGRPCPTAARRVRRTACRRSGCRAAGRLTDQRAWRGCTGQDNWPVA